MIKAIGVVAGQYVKPDELERLTTTLFSKLDRIEDKFDGKADKVAGTDGVPKYDPARPWRNTARRRALRGQRLAIEPCCRMCKSQGKVKHATIVDHIKPHRGDEVLFFNFDNTQSLCKLCHDSHKQRTEKSGRVVGCDLNGMPIDAHHHWRQS